MKLTMLTKLKQRLLGIPIPIKVLGIAVGMTISLGAVMAWQIHYSYGRLENEELEEQASFVAQVLATGASPMLQSGDLAGVQRLLEAVRKITPATGTRIDRIKVKAGDGRVVASSAQPRKGGGRVFEGTAALPGGSAGTVSVELTDGHIGFETGWHTRRILVATTVIVWLGIFAGSALILLVTHPIRELVQVTRSVKGGNLEARAPIRAEDEIGELALAFNDMLTAVQEKEALNQRLMRRLVAAEEKQRRNLSHDLRDQTAQVLSSLVMGLAAVEKGADRRHLAEMRQAASQALSEVSDLSFALQPAVLEEIGLVAALQSLCQRLSERFGIIFACSADDFDGALRLRTEVELALYRGVQEAVANAVQHGHPRSVEVRLQCRSDSVLATVTDDGEGFDASDWHRCCLQSGHLGLLGIQERAALVGGLVRVDSKPGAGTRVFVEIPLRNQSREQVPA